MKLRSLGWHLNGLAQADSNPPLKEKPMSKQTEAQQAYQEGYRAGVEEVVKRLRKANSLEAKWRNGRPKGFISSSVELECQTIKKELANLTKPTK